MDSPIAFATADLELTLSPGLSEVGTVARSSTQQHKPAGAPTRKSFAPSGSGSYPELSVGANARYVYFAAHQIDTGDVSHYTYVDFMQGGVVQAQLRWNSDTGIVTLYKGSGSTLLATSSGSLARGAWHWIKVDLTAAESGRFRVWADQDYATPVADSGAGVDTRATSTDGFDTVRLRHSNGTVVPYFADVVVYANGATPPDGEMFLIAKRPTGNGTLTGLTASAGSNWQTVDEDPPSDADYNEGTAPNLGDRYTHGALPWTPDAIAFVAPVSRMRREGTITQGRNLWKSDATTATGAALTLPGAGSYAVVTDPRGTDPHTSADWAQAAVEAVETGAEIL